MRAWPNLGLAAFAAGTALGVWLVWRSWNAHSSENPLLILVLVWVIGGFSHVFVRKFWEACATCTVGSMMGYVGLAFALTPDPLQNEMFVPGIIEVGILGFLASMIMGAPVALYRRFHS